MTERDRANLNVGKVGCLRQGAVVHMQGLSSNTAVSGKRVGSTSTSNLGNAYLLRHLAGASVVRGRPENAKTGSPASCVYVSEALGGSSLLKFASSVTLFRGVFTPSDIASLWEALLVEYGVFETKTSTRFSAIKSDLRRTSRTSSRLLQARRFLLKIKSNSKAPHERYGLMHVSGLGAATTVYATILSSEYLGSRVKIVT
ncbi:hypothetical protein CHU98_g11154, partial [Xylaria longipes]